MDFVKELTKLLKDATITRPKKDIIVKSKDRNGTKTIVEKWLVKNKVDYKDLFKASKSSSINVFEITGIADIIFKPIIQKGAGGVKFEHELAADLLNYWNGVDKKDLGHSDVISEMEKVLKISPKKKWSIVPMGSMNQKRKLTFSGKSNLSVSNSTGKTLTDITIKNDAKASEELYLSLKMSKSFYILSAAIEQYFADPATQVNLCEFFGMDGYKMGGFGIKYRCETNANYTKAKANLQKFLGEVYGSEVVIIHKKAANDVKVSNLGKSKFSTVSLNALNEDSYVYPEPGVRKYAVIKMRGTINGSSYKVDFQFRGTTAADVGPKYLRILLERLS
jgi:hypothetical protein